MSWILCLSFVRIRVLKHSAGKHVLSDTKCIEKDNDCDIRLIP